MNKTVAVFTVMAVIAVLAGAFFLPAEANAQTRSMRCWRCQRTFEADTAVRRGNCPHCGAQYALPQPTPTPRVVDPDAPPSPTPDAVPFEDAERYMGQTITIEGRIVGTFLSRRSGHLYLNYHDDFRRHVSIKIPAPNLARFPASPERYYDGKTVRATGRIVREGQYLRQEVTDPENLEVIEPGAGSFNFQAPPPRSAARRPTRRTASLSESYGDRDNGNGDSD